MFNVQLHELHIQLYIGGLSTMKTRKSFILFDTLNREIGRGIAYPQGVNYVSTDTPPTL